MLPDLILCTLVNHLFNPKQPSQMEVLIKYLDATILDVKSQLKHAWRYMAHHRNNAKNFMARGVSLQLG